MSEWIADFYDLLSADYHAIYADWRSEVLRQGKILDALIRRHLGERQVSGLDCACGIGTQARGLARWLAERPNPSEWISLLP